MNARMGESHSLLLDLLRFVLSLAVVVGHGLGFFWAYFDGFFPDRFPHFQSIAVVAFFFLSGYLIVGSQLTRAAGAGHGVWHYLFDRVTRVYVTLVPCLLFVVLVDKFFLTFTALSLEMVKSYTTSALLVENLLLVLTMPYGTMRPIWSLMYEWWVYMLFGGLFFLRSNPVPAALMLAGGLYYTFRVNGLGEAGPIWIVWAVGGVCAFAQRRIDWSRIPRSVLWVATLGFLAYACVLYVWTLHAFDIRAGVALSLALFAFIHLGDGFGRILIPMAGLVRRLAGLSFTLFLTHYSVLTYTREYLLLTGWAGFLVGLLVSGMVAFGIAYCTEYRLSAIKSWLRRIGTRARVAL